MRNHDTNLKLLAEKRKVMRQSIGSNFQFTKEVLKPANIISRTKKRGFEKLNHASDRIKQATTDNRKAISIGGAIIISGLATGIWYKIKNKDK